MTASRRHFLAALPGLAAAVTAAAQDRRQPRVLLRSSWQTVNIGDIAHTPGMIALLTERVPGVELTLWPGNLGDGVKELLTRHFPQLRFADTADARREAFDRCDFLLHGSGPSLVGGRQVAEWKEKTNKPYGVLGITLSAADAAARAVLDGARFLYLRDSGSVEWARQAGLRCPVIDFAPDAAFSTTIRDAAGAETYLRANGLWNERFVCFIPRLRYTPYWLIRNTPMTDADREKDRTNQRLKESDHAKVRAALVAVVRDAGMKVLVCPEDKSHMAVGKEMLIDPLPADVRAKVVWREHYWLTDLALAVYARSAGLVSMDMHSPIMAVGNGIPAIHCRFAEQTSKGRMWRDIGLGDWLFDLDEERDGSRITAAALAMLRRDDDTRTRLMKAQAYVQERQRAAVGVLARQLPA
ncbi:polysaccharide pyruvyl transferase family protein [bacterium]|nr:polysaccharide pyruvyl transferase family protein [bacterium]